MSARHGPLVPFATTCREPVADCRVFRVERVHRRSGRTGEEHEFFHIDAAEWVNVVPVTAEGDLVLVRQERHGICAPTLEVPGGVVEPGEDPAAAALRELLEETGYRGARAEPLGWVHPNPALQDNRCHSFLAPGVVRVGDPSLDGREEIEVVTVPLAAAADLVRRGEITHALVLCALYRLALAGP
jgi:8-oxo-dGTP pyrophosphatase MutT (NUDIX family)